MANNPFATLAVWFALFYFIQGILASYRTYEERYLSLNFGKTGFEAAQSQALFFTAWALKPLHGWLTDNVSLCGLGYRRPWAFLGAMLGGLTFLLLPLIAPVGAGWSAYLFLIFLRSFGIAQADAAVDGLLIDADVGNWGSMFQGLMMSSRNVGELFAVLVGAQIAGPRVSSDLWYFCGAFILVPGLFAFIVKEERLVTDAFEWGALRQLVVFPVVMLNLWNVLGQVGDRLPAVLVSKWAATEFGLSPSEIGYMSAAGLVFQILGSLAMGAVMDTWNRRALLVAESALYVVSNVVQLWVRSREGVWLFYIFSGFAAGVHICALNRMIFLFAPRNSSATFLAVCAMVGHLSSITGTLLGGWISDTFGYYQTIVAGAVVSAAMMGPVFFFTSPQYDPVTKKMAELQTAKDAKARELGLNPGDLSSLGAQVVSNPVASIDKLSVLMASPGGSGGTQQLGGGAPWLRDSVDSEAAFGRVEPPEFGGEAAPSGAGAGAASRRSAVVEGELSKLSALATARSSSLVTPQRGANLPVPRDKPQPLGAALRAGLGLSAPTAPEYAPPGPPPPAQRTAVGGR